KIAYLVHVGRAIARAAAGAEGVAAAAGGGRSSSGCRSEIVGDWGGGDRGEQWPEQRSLGISNLPSKQGSVERETSGDDEESEKRERGKPTENGLGLKLRNKARPTNDGFRFDPIDLR
ncbi:hypothetical protein CRG98_039507, partial [Punica granatum]